jgi:predicted MFS family arabinose efflux permease
MGFAFPSAVRIISSSKKNTSLGIYWAFNSLASVVGSILAILLAIEVGFTAVMAIAACCYLLAGILWSWIKQGDS